MPSPCVRVHLRMGDPPPIAAYCSSILGVRRRAMSGARVDWKGSGIKSVGTGTRKGRVSRKGEGQLCPVSE